MKTHALSEPVRPARPSRFAGAIRSAVASLFLLQAVVLAACERPERAAPERGATLRIGGIPDQDVARLERMFGLVAAYLERRTGIPVEYVPSNDYAALVSAFQRGDVQLAWFGGLTGVQALEVTPGAHAIAQRPRDRKSTRLN